MSDTETVTVGYKTIRGYCPCCGQKIENAKESEVKEFHLTKENMVDYADWELCAEFEEDLQESVREYVYNTISFFATNSMDLVIIEDNQIEKVRQFILDNLKS